MMILFVITGVIDIYAMVLGFFCNMAMILFGDASDKFRRLWLVWTKAEKLLVLTDDEREAIAFQMGTAQESLANAKIMYLFGAFIGFIPWACLISSFSQAIDRAGPDQNIPWFLYVIPVVLFFNFAAFGIVQALVLWKGGCGYEFTFKHGEAWFILLSLTAKVALSYQAFFAVVFSR